MKKMMCDICGSMGMKHEITGNTEKEVMDKTLEHMKEFHPKEAKEMMQMPKAEQDKMMMEVKKKISDVM